MITRHKITLQTITPVAHGDTVTGIDNATNTRLFMRQAGHVGERNAPMRVPSISENALRSSMIRRTLHDDLLARLGVGLGELSQGVVNLLYAGGHMAGGVTEPGDQNELGHAVRKFFPSLHLLGGTVDRFILPRSALRLCAWIVCKENLHAIRALAPELEPLAQNSSLDMLFDETRVRGTGEHASGNQMLYTYETLSAGATIFLELTLDAHKTSILSSCLSQAISGWDGFIGGQGRQGRGRAIIASNDLPTSDEYLAHFSEHSEAMLEGLKTGTLGTKRVLLSPDGRVK